MNLKQFSSIKMAIPQLAFLFTVSCQPIIQVPPDEKKQGWPTAPQEVTLERNWTISHAWEMFGTYAVLGDVLCYAGDENGGEPDHIKGYSLSTGELLWKKPLPSVIVGIVFSDGEYFYAAALSLERDNNHFARFTPQGEFEGFVYYYVQGYEKNYKAPELRGLYPESFFRDWYTLDGSIMYFQISYPSLRSEYQDVKTGGGLYSLDFSQVQPTDNPEEFTVTLKKVFDRTNPETRYTIPVVHRTEEGRKLLLFAEVFQYVAGLPPRLPNGWADLDYTSKHVAIHCVDAQTGESLWRHVDPWTIYDATIIPGKDRVWVANYDRSSLLNLADGKLIWETPQGQGASTPYSQVVVGDVAYSNKDEPNSATGLEALDLKTGKPLWSRYQHASQGYGIFHHKGVLYVLNQTGIRLYRASDGKYLALDSSFNTAVHGNFPNKSFVWNGNMIVYGDVQTASFKMNYALDIFGNLVKE